MNYREMTQAVEDAKQTTLMADIATNDMAKMLIGRLRKVNKDWEGYRTLAALKKELTQYNVKTGEWKN